MPSPAGRQRADLGVVPGDPKRIVRPEPGIRTGAPVPPVRRGVDRRDPAGAGTIGVREVAQPPAHRLRAEAVTGLAVRVVLGVQHSGQSAAVRRPRAAVVDEIVRLVAAIRDVGPGEMVGPADHADGIGTVVLLDETRVDESGAFGCLDVNEFPTRVPGTGPVDVALMPADVVAQRGARDGDRGLATGTLMPGELRARECLARPSVLR